MRDSPFFITFTCRIYIPSKSLRKVLIMSMKVFASANNFVSLTPSDTTSVNCKSLYIGNTGDVALAPSTTADAVIFYNVPSGTFLPVELKSGRVMSTNTTATGIISLGW